MTFSFFANSCVVHPLFVRIHTLFWLIGRSFDRVGSRLTCLHSLSSCLQATPFIVVFIFPTVPPTAPFHEYLFNLTTLAILHSSLLLHRHPTCSVYKMACPMHFRLVPVRMRNSNRIPHNILQYNSDHAFRQCTISLSHSLSSPSLNPCLNQKPVTCPFVRLSILALAYLSFSTYLVSSSFLRSKKQRFLNLFR